MGDPAEMARLIKERKRASKAGHDTGKDLVVWIKSATALDNADGPFSGASDPYVIVQIVDGDGNPVTDLKFETRTIQNRLTPVWNEQFAFEGLDHKGTDPASLTVQLTVWDGDSFCGFDNLAADYKLGWTTFSLESLENSMEFQEQELTLKRGEDDDAGTVIVAFNTLGTWG